MHNTTQFCARPNCGAELATDLLDLDRHTNQYYCKQGGCQARAALEADDAAQEHRKVLAAAQLELFPPA